MFITTNDFPLFVMLNGNISFSTIKSTTIKLDENERRKLQEKSFNFLAKLLFFAENNEFKFCFKDKKKI